MLLVSLSCPGCVTSQFLVHPACVLAGVHMEAGEPFMLSEHFSAVLMMVFSAQNPNPTSYYEEN